MSRWVPTVVEALCESKRNGLPFNAAWGLAITRHRPRLNELGITYAVSNDEAENLFEQPSAKALEWFRRVCEDAYEDRPKEDGSPSRMRGLRDALDGGFAEPEFRRGRQASKYREAA
jgi:hypothetical protein